MPSIRCSAVVLHRHDVADGDFLARVKRGPSSRRTASPRCRARDRPRAWRQRSAASVCAAQPVTTMRASGPLAAKPADGLARLPHRFAGDRAGVDDHGIGNAGGVGLAADHLRLVGVEPAAEGDDIDAHAAPGLGEQRRIEAALELELDRAGHQHVIVALAPFDREIAARQRDAHLAPGALAAARRRPRRRRPPSRRPWSGRRRAPRCGSRCARATCTAQSVMLARSGKIGWFSSSGPILARS